MTDPTARPAMTMREIRDRLGHARPDATPAPVWIDGDPLMEAIAAAVYEQCDRHPEVAVTIDDPRNIAAVAAAVARQVLGTAGQQPASVGPAALHDRIAVLLAEKDGWKYAEGFGLRDMSEATQRHYDKLAAAVVAVLPAPVDRVAILREVADECDEAGAAYTGRAQNEHAGAAFTLMETFLRKANEAEYAATPCDFVACEPGGEPCSTHERLMAHAEGEHELCAPDCGSTASPTP
jgi:hypothetical protein